MPLPARLGLALDWLGVRFVLGQPFVALTLLEIVNYAEHCGLHRRTLDDGRYERTNPRHSWNSNFPLTKLFLLHLQRHFDDSPQSPNGHAGMIVPALIPPLWHAVMDPRVLTMPALSTS